MIGAVNQRINYQLLITGWVRFYLVVFEYGQLDLLPLMLVLLGGGVGLLLPFLGTTTQPQHQVERRLLEEEKRHLDHHKEHTGSDSSRTDVSSPSGCCSRTACVHPPAASQRRSASAGQEGYLQEARAAS